MNAKQIHELINKFEKSRLTELSLENEGFRLHLKSETTVVSPEHILQSVTQAASPSSAAAAPAPQAAPAAQAAEEEGETEIITSPIVGTFYRTPAPDAPPFVEEGKSVDVGDSLCIIEAMKIMNKLEAEFPCEVLRVLAENSSMVEYGTPLFEVKRL